MRHRKAGRKLGRKSGPRWALLNGLVTNLVRDERIRTTDAKAKEVKRLAERTITWGARVAPLLAQPKEKLVEHEQAKIVHAMRMAHRTVRDKAILHKLFHEIAPRYIGRPGGYTRIIKVGYRPGDAAPMSFLELLPAPPRAEAPGKKKGPAKDPAGGKAKAA